MSVISIRKLDLSKVKFEEVKDKKVGNFKYKEIRIKRENDDGELVDLILRTKEVFSFGVSKSKIFANESYSLPLCLYTKDNPTKEEKDWVKKFEEIIEKCNEQIKKNKSLRKMGKVNALFWKEGNEDAGPVLFAKMPCWEGKFSCKMFGVGKEIEPKDMIDKFCKVKTILKISSLTITDKITLKVQLCHAKVTLLIEREEEEKEEPDWWGSDSDNDSD